MAIAFERIAAALEQLARPNAGGGVVAPTPFCSGSGGASVAIKGGGGAGGYAA